MVRAGGELFFQERTGAFDTDATDTRDLAKRIQHIAFIERDLVQPAGKNHDIKDIALL